MFCKSYSGVTIGIDGFVISVEADISDGLPEFCMVGGLASEVKEAKERVRIALKNSGYRLQPKRITVNLSPADMRKAGTTFDLPIAISILAASGYIPQNKLDKPTYNPILNKLYPVHKALSHESNIPSSPLSVNFPTIIIPIITP